MTDAPSNLDPLTRNPYYPYKQTAGGRDISDYTWIAFVSAFLFAAIPNLEPKKTKAQTLPPISRTLRERILSFKSVRIGVNPWQRVL